MKINDRVTFKDEENKKGWIGYITAFGVNDPTKVYVTWVEPQAVGEWLNVSRLRKAKSWE